MIHRTVATIDSIVLEREGAQEIIVSVVENQGGISGKRNALNLIELTGRVSVGDSVLLNTIAVEMGLGTGGLDFVIAKLDDTVMESDPAGHIFKLRYTPLQMPVLSSEAPESPYHEAIKKFDSLCELPVICAELHSQLPPICAGILWHLKEAQFNRTPKIAYLMTQGASLPIALSKSVSELKAKGWISSTITSGQAFGGDYEAVNIYSALAIAKEVVKADIVVMCQGPGNVGTDTSLGFSGIEQGEAVNAVASLGGNPFICPRISFSDTRERHEGLSHHTFTILKRICHVHATVALPRFRDMHQQGVIQDEINSARLEERYDFVTIDGEPGLAFLQNSGLSVCTMGRSLNEDVSYFLTAVVAGVLGGQSVETQRSELSGRE